MDISVIFNLPNIIGAIFIIVVGSLAHFLYEWTGHNKFIGFFTAVNESTWEHLKLIILPSLLWLIIEIHIYTGEPNLLFAHFIGLLAALLFIPLTFYAYTALTKRDFFILDILLFACAAVLEQFVFGAVLNWQGIGNELTSHVGIIGLSVIFIIYLTHTFLPGRNFLTRDPVTHRYGFSAHFGKVCLSSRSKKQEASQKIEKARKTSKVHKTNKAQKTKRNPRG